ncbi:MAG: apolipoprotein N-acyltransferase [Nocardioidaceae bacterium]
MSPKLSMRAVLALCAGLLVGCGFAPLESITAMLAGLLVLVWSLYGTTVRQGTLVGAAFGLGFFGLLVSWVGVLGIGVWCALVASQVVYLAIFGGAASALQRLPVWPIWWAATWVAVEALRSTFPLGGFPWGRLAFATVDSPLVSYARVLGTAALSGLVFALVAFVLYAWVNRARAGAVVASTGIVVAAIAVSVALPVAVAGADADTHRIALVQGGVPGTGATGLGEQREVLDNHIRATLSYARSLEQTDTPPPEAVFWPENASDIDPFRDAEAGKAIDSAVRRLGAPVLVGAVLDGDDGTSPENAGIVWDPRSGAGDRYLKRHLVPFGEYVPFRDFIDTVLPYVTDEIPYDMTPGETVGVLELGGFTVGDMMCYDVAYDDAAYDAVEAGADVLAVQTNNATYTTTNQPEQQWQLARFRAIETGRDVVVPSTNGVSGVASGSGDVLAKSDSHGAQVLSADITTGSGITPAVRYGETFELAGIAIAAGALVVALALGRRRRRHTEPAPQQRAMESVR